MKAKFTSVYIKDREHRVIARNGVVYSGPFAGGSYRPLPKQDSKNAKLARELVDGLVFNEGAYTTLW